jgi:hypothetical protein
VASFRVRTLTGSGYPKDAISAESFGVPLMSGSPLKPPTALHALAEAHETPPSALLRGPRLGLDERDQAVPFHDRINVRAFKGLGTCQPTALHELADTHDTLAR